MINFIHACPPSTWDGVHTLSDQVARQMGLVPTKLWGEFATFI
jgi:hypothetical protein